MAKINFDRYICDRCGKSIDIDTSSQKEVAAYWKVVRHVDFLQRLAANSYNEELLCTSCAEKFQQFMLNKSV